MRSAHTCTWVLGSTAGLVRDHLCGSEQHPQATHIQLQGELGQWMHMGNGA